MFRAMLCSQSLQGFWQVCDSLLFLLSCQLDIVSSPKPAVEDVLVGSIEAAPSPRAVGRERFKGSSRAVGANLAWKILMLI